MSCTPRIGPHPRTRCGRRLGIVTVAVSLLALARAESLTEKSTGTGMSVDQLLALHHSETERVRMVMLEASVTDRKGRVVRGLEEGDFRIFEGEVPQEIRFFSADSAEPISVAFLLDVSGSMEEQGKLHRAKEAIRSLVAELRPEDRTALICFADHRVVWATDFEDDRTTFLRNLMFLEGYGRTALIDAIAAAPHLVQDRISTRKAIVLITDGNDNFSTTPLAEAVELARRVDVPLYTIAFLSVSPAWLPKGGVDARIDVVQAVAAVTGGRVFAVYGDDELHDAVDLLEAELSSQYIIGYYPESDPPTGVFQEIRLEVAKRRLRARTRSGYYAP